MRAEILRQLEERGQLGLLGAVYRLADGEIEWLQDGKPEKAAAKTTTEERASVAARARPHGDHTASNPHVAHHLAHDAPGKDDHGTDHHHGVDSHAGDGHATHADEHAAHAPPAAPGGETKRLAAPHAASSPSKNEPDASGHHTAHAPSASKPTAAKPAAAVIEPTPPPANMVSMLLLSLVGVIAGAALAQVFLRPRARAFPSD